jgi:hypothetical protein
LALAACGQSQSVDKPMAEVYMTLSSLPADADAMSLATAVLPGTSYWVEPVGANKIVWHFKREAGEYGRYVAELSEDGPGKTTVATHFEDGETGANMAFLRDIAKLAGDASIRAALTGQPVDRAAVQAQIRQQIASNPVAAQIATIETVSDEMHRMAPPDKCKTGTSAEMNSWVCQKHGHTIDANGVIRRSDTGAIETSTEH